MGKKLIIAEKPSQAREYAKVLGVRRQGDGFFENEEYVITWCYGHLLELERPEVYMDLEKVGKRWSLRRLPVLPGLTEFRRLVKPGSAKQFQVVQRFLHSSEIQEVICGTDADREGQLLFQEVWDAAGCEKPLTRLWISSLTAKAIMEGMNKLKPAQEVRGLAAAGHGRAYADWDFGMNLTEGFTSLFGSFDAVRKKPNVISIGRVQTPTLALIVEREWEIEDFVPQPFFEVRAEFAAAAGNYPGKWFDAGDEARKLTKPGEAEEIVRKTFQQPGMINKLNQKEVHEPPPLLFDLTSLTVACSQKFSFSAERVLQLAQGLYEKKAITYPRTDCAYLSEDLIPKLPEHLSAAEQAPYLDIVKEARSYGVPKGKRVINTISAHHAIIPTTEKISPARLTPDEQKLYDLIVRRFLAVWFPAAVYKQTDVITEVAGEKFRTRGKVLVSAGWKSVYGKEDEGAKNEPQSLPGKKTRSSSKNKSEQNEQEELASLPPLTLAENVKADKVYQVEKTTNPPKRYTQGDLLKAMESAGKQIDDEVLRQQLKGKGLGTVATRPAIIENLLDRGYICQEQKTLKPTSKGVELIKVIKERLPKAKLLISAEMTGQMEFRLARVEKGQLPLEEYMKDVELAIQQIIDELRLFEKEQGKRPLAFAPEPASRNKRAGKTQSKTAPGKSTSIKTSTAKAAKTKSSQVNSASTQSSLSSSQSSSQSSRKKAEGSEQSAINSPPILGVCPNCGGRIIEGQKGFGCLNWKQGCHFVIWKNKLCGKVPTPSQIKALLKRGKTPLIKGFQSESGKRFDAYLVLDGPKEGKLKFEFPK